jgi:hypothetical protein
LTAGIARPAVAPRLSTTTESVLTTHDVPNDDRVHPTEIAKPLVLAHELAAQGRSAAARARGFLF